MQEIVLEVASQATMALLGLVLMAVSAFGSFYIKKAIAHLEEKNLVETVRRYVRWVEQAPAFQQWTGEEKFEIVMSKALQYAEGKGLKINADEIGIMIEEAVRIMKEAASPLLPVTP